MLWRRSAFLILFVAALPALGQATFDAQSSVADVYTAGAPTTTLAHTTTTAVNRVLLVSVHMNVRNSTGTTITGVTYGGQALTFLDEATSAIGGTIESRTEVWYLLSPPTGTNNVIVTAAGITANVEAYVGATTFSNANQLPPASAANTGEGNTTVTIAAASTTDTIVDFVTGRETVAYTVGAGQTQGYNATTGGTSDDLQAATSRRTATTPTTTMTWTSSSGTRDYSVVAVNIPRANADVQVTKYATPDPVEPGGTLTYRMVVKNSGPSLASGVSLTDTIPATTTFVSSRTTQGSCSGSPAVTCTIGNMAFDAEVTVTIVVTAPLTSGPIATNTATVSSTTFDSGTPNTGTATSHVLVQATVCGTQPGKDGAGGTLAGVVNSYWQGNSSPAAGATSLTVTGARRGAANSITAGDLVLIIQMQDAAIDSSNDDRYGDGKGTAGNKVALGAGYTNANNAGRYEYVIATNTVGAGPAAQTFNFTGVGTGNGLVYAYTNAAATATQGQRRYQIVRVPQYTSATLGATLTASAWNGTTGGILAIDVAGNLALGSTTVNVNGLGFRGGAGLQQAGGAGANDDYRSVIANTTNGIKGEGIAGTPEWVLDSGANLDVGGQGYPNGDFARGAPGNAGGGGTDGETITNQDNTGGGGGANWGRGGMGGISWQSKLSRGGFGGAPFYDSPGRVVLGGGGGAGSRNNSTGIASAGGAGGGIVLIRTGSMSGTGTITANGAAAYNDTANDGGGGGGGGGSIVILARGAGIGGLTTSATGGRGGDAWRTEPIGTPPADERHGPGGGGGGGFIALNGAPAASSVAGGAQGITTTNNDTYGAQAGAVGIVVTNANHDQITGIKSGCLDLTVSISDSPDPVFAGNNITYTQTVTNNSTVVPGQNVTITQTTPPGTTFVSMTPPAGWTCGTLPAVGGTGSVVCTYTAGAFPVSATSGNFLFVVKTDQALANGSSISQTVTVASSNPETNNANNSATAITTVQRRVDVAVTKVANDPGSDGAFSQGETLTYTIVVTNNGPSRATNVVMTDPLPAGFSFVSVTPGGPTCTQASGTVTCTYATMDSGASNNIVISGTITVSSTQLSNTANTTRTETDTNAANNSATVVVSVNAPTVVHMLEMQAVQDGKGKVVLTWTTKFESENLGFNIYRESSAGRTKLNKHLVAGSTFFSKRDELHSGRGYRWKDKIRPGEFAQYSIEDIDLHGVRTLHGPITPSFAGSVPDEASTDTIADLGTADGAVFLSPRGIGMPRYPVIQPTRQQREQQWDLASQPAVKLMVTQEGWYRVTRAQLAAAGFDAGDTKKLALFAEGIEQPVVVTDDAVEFYGIGIDTAAAGARAYWLVSDKGTKLRVKNEKGKKGAQSVASTPFTISRVERFYYFTWLINNGEKENFFGTIITSAGATQELAVEHVDPNGNASMEIAIQGGTAGAHDIRLDVNGHYAGSLQLTSQDRRVATFTFPSSYLAEGANTLTLTSLLGDMDVSVVEFVRLTWPHRLVADDNALKLSISGGSTATIDGFTTADIRALDITDPTQPIALEVEVGGSGASRSASIVAPALGASTGTRTILVLGDARVLAPAQIVPSRASKWNEKNNAADLLIISARAFAPAAEPLKAKRDSQGIVTNIVDIEDVYDEFGFGERGPEAIRELLLRSREWKRAPKYVILLGDATFDPRNYLGIGAFDYVPTKLLPTTEMKTAVDDWFSDFANNDLPQIAIGRLPARTLADAQLMIGRIVNRDTSNNTRVSFVVDGTDALFDASAHSLASLVTPGLQTTFDQAPVAADFESLLITYVGHGSNEFWAAGSFTGAAASQLTNTKLPVFASLTCLNGYFHDVYQVSMAEALLLNPNGGAVAAWASSSLTEPEPQADMGREFFRQLFAGATLGDASMRAKAATTDRDVRRSWILLGDPSMKLR